METSESGEVKQESGFEGALSPRILASKIYRITGRQQGQMEDFKQELEIDEDYFYERLFPLKTEIQHPKCDNYDFTENKYNNQNTNTTLTKWEELETYENNIVLLCPFCGIEFPYHFEWREHLNDFHGFNKPESLNMELRKNGKAKCKQCSFSSSKLQALQVHRITHLPYSKFKKCKLCQTTFSSIGFRLGKHVGCKSQVRNNCVGLDDASTNDAILLCPYCGVEFENRKGWRLHLDKIHEFSKSENLNMLTCENGIVKCKDCKFTTSKGKWVQQQHRITHLPYSKYKKCKLCLETFDGTRNKFKDHCGRTHPKKAAKIDDSAKASVNNIILLCPYCGTEYHSNNEWRSHLDDVHQFHNQEVLNMEFYEDKTARCKQCHEVLIGRHKWVLREHKITHLPYNLYVKCKLCGEYFERMQLLINHLKKKCSKCPYQQHLCPLCGIAFSSFSDWREHLNHVHELYTRERANK